MDEIVRVIEQQFPQLQWLVRRTAEGPDRDNLGSPYYAHLYARHYVKQGYPG